MPEEIMNMTKLVLIPDYFVPNEDGFKLPKLIKRHKTELDVGYEMRIKNHLLNMSDTNFARVAEIIDPDDL